MEEEEPFWSLITEAERTRLTGAGPAGIQTFRIEQLRESLAQGSRGQRGRMGGAEGMARAGGYSLSLFRFDFGGVLQGGLCPV